MNPFLSTAHGRPPVRLDARGTCSLTAYPGRTQRTEEASLLGWYGPLPIASDVDLPELAASVVTVSGNAERFQATETPLRATSVGRGIEKLSWCPRTGELLFVHPPLQHRTARGTHPFDDYVRLIVLTPLRLVCARPCWPSWLRSGSAPRLDAAALRASTVLQLQARRVLLATPSDVSWAFELNIDNRRLEHLTGRRGW